MRSWAAKMGRDLYPFTCCFHTVGVPDRLALRCCLTACINRSQMPELLVLNRMQPVRLLCDGSSREDSVPPLPANLFGLCKNPPIRVVRRLPKTRSYLMRQGVNRQAKRCAPLPYGSFRQEIPLFVRGNGTVREADGFRPRYAARSTLRPRCAFALG